MGIQLPEQFKNDLERIEQEHETGNEHETSIQQDIDEDAAEVVAETFDITDRNLPIARDHIRNYRRDSMQNDDAQQDNYQTNILSTDQDTIIDQDDDVAEECSAEQDHIQGQ